MSKILKASEIEAAAKKAKTVEDYIALIPQIVASVLLQEGEANTLAENLKNEKAEGEKLALEIAEAEKQLEEANETIVALSEQLTLKEENPEYDEIVTIDGLNYAIVGKRFITTVGTITAKELAKNTDLVKEFIEKGSGAIILLPSKN